MPRLDLYVNYELQATVKLGGAEVILGRDPACEVCMPDEQVSRRHAVIRAQGEAHEIENRGRNGTKVNGRPVESPQALVPGDVIFIAHYVLIYQSDDVPPAELDQTIEAI